MARPLSTSRALSPTLSGPQLAAVVNEVAASSPIAEVAVAQACKRQSDGIVRTRSGTLYATATMSTTAAGVFAAGTTQDIFNVPVGQAGSGFGAAAPLTKAQTNMTQAGLLASEAFSVDKIGFSVSLNSAFDALSGDLVNPMLQWIYNNTVAELHLGGQDVQVMGTLAQWVDTFTPQPTAGALSGAVGPVNTAFRPGLANTGYEGLRDFELFIPQQVPFKVKLTIPAASAFTVPIAAVIVAFEIKCSMYGTSVTAIQA
jgi:hypothetical protein